MNPIRVIAIVLIVLGVLGLTYGSFRFTKESHDAKLGPIELSVKETERINVPRWAGIAAIAAGTVMLLVRTRG